MRGAKENSVSNDRNDRKFSDGHDRKTMYPDKNMAAPVLNYKHYIIIIIYKIKIIY